MKNQLIYIKDILEAIDKILNFSGKIDFETFLNDTAVHDAIMYNFIVIGEASNRLSEDFKNQHNNIEWHKLKGMRNHLAHSYDEIDYSVVWDTILNNLPSLRSQIQKIIQNK